jgi:ABC-2 type transport system permease protein
MRWLPVFKKEMRLYFGSPVAYVVLVFFLGISGFIFVRNFLAYSDTSMRSFMQPQFGQNLNTTEHLLGPLVFTMGFLLLFLMPLVSMRMFSEERKSGTIELLLTYPVRDGAVLVGKYLAAFALYLVLLVLTLLYPGLVAYFVRVEWGAVLSGYLGLLLLGGTFLAVGALISSLTENQIVAAFGTFLVLLVFWLVSLAGEFTTGNLRSVFQYLSFPERLDGFTRGIVDTKDIVFHVTGIGLALFLTLRSLESKRWNG